MWLLQTKLRFEATREVPPGIVVGGTPELDGRHTTPQHVQRPPWVHLQLVPTPLWPVSISRKHPRDLTGGRW